MALDNTLLFLDIDGVLNANTGDRFNYISISTLNAVFKSIPYDVVISSSWRNHVDMRELRDMFEYHGMIAKVVGKTPNFYSLKSREYEIISYLDGNKNIEYFVILDDYNDFKELTQHFVHIDNSMGLIPDYIDEIKNKLALKINRKALLTIKLI